MTGNAELRRLKDRMRELKRSNASSVAKTLEVEILREGAGPVAGKKTTLHATSALRDDFR